MGVEKALKVVFVRANFTLQTKINSRRPSLLGIRIMESRMGSSGVTTVYRTRTQSPIWIRALPLLQVALLLIYFGAGVIVQHNSV